MVVKIKNSFLLGIIIFTLCSSTLPVPLTKTAQAMSNNLIYPAIGLYCADNDRIICGSEKFDLTDAELFSKQTAKKYSEYRVSGNELTTFEIPFFSTYTDIPQFNLTVNGQAVKGEVWYGDNQIYYGGNNYYLQFDRKDNNILIEKLTRTYAPVLDENLVGTLYTLTPDEDTITISIKLSNNCSYVYDKPNIFTQSYKPDNTQIFKFYNALTQTNYQYFFIGENAVTDFSSSCEYQTEQMTFKDFIDRNYNLNKEFHNKSGAPIECVYAIANRILQNKVGIAYSDLFYNSFANVVLNSYKFTLPLSGEVTVKYTSVVNIQKNERYSPTIYAVGQKQIGNYKTDYYMVLNNDNPYIVQSSNSTKKSGMTFKSSATENFYFMCSSSKRPIETAASTQPKFNITQIILIVVFGIICVISLIWAIVGFVLYIRNKRRLSNT